jgi:ankyrin repeat protein
MEPVLGEAPKNRIMTGLSEWNYDIPLAFKILLSGDPKICHTSIWGLKEKVALIGDFASGVENLKHFLGRIRHPDAKAPIEETLEFLNKTENINTLFVLECAEIFVLSGKDENLEQRNLELLDHIQNQLDDEIENLLAKLNHIEPPPKQGLFSKIFGKAQTEHDEDPSSRFYALGLGNWSNILYYHFDNTPPQTMKKKDIKQLFKSIRNHDNDTAKNLIESLPEIIHSTASSPPKKDDGQIPLQVAFKTGNHEIAKLLIDKGSDVNFMETDSINEWTAPVLHDAIMAAVNGVLYWCGEQKSKEAIDLLRQMLTHGADPNSQDSYGNNCLGRALLDTKQIIDHPIYSPKMDTPLKEIFNILITAGADTSASSETRKSAQAYAENNGLEAFLELR